jgi:hypothetical protein
VKELRADALLAVLPAVEAVAEAPELNRDSAP